MADSADESKDCWGTGFDERETNLLWTSQPLRMQSILIQGVQSRAVYLFLNVEINGMNCHWFSMNSSIIKLSIESQIAVLRCMYASVQWLFYVYDYATCVISCTYIKVYLMLFTQLLEFFKSAE